MSEQRRHLERALRECAERGAPADTVDLWPAIKERVSGTRASGTQASEEDRVAESPRRRLLIIPDTPLGWVLAVLSVLILGAGVYGVSGPFREVFRDGLPGPGAAGTRETTEQGQVSGGAGGNVLTDRLFQSLVAGGGGEELLQTRTADGAKVTLERAYADEEFVVVSYSVQDRRDAREIDGPFGELRPFFVGKDDEGEPGVPSSPHRGSLTDESGAHYDFVDGTSMVAGPGAGPEGLGKARAHAAIFEAPDGLEPNRAHRFRLEVPLYEGGSPVRKYERPDAGPFVFDFEAFVRPAPVVESSQQDTAKGITLTLDRVVSSPVRPQAVVCFEPPDDEHEWTPIVGSTGFFWGEASDGVRRSKRECWSAMPGTPVEGRSSVRVEKLTGVPKNPSDTAEAVAGQKTIRGPWTFEFDVPDQ